MTRAKRWRVAERVLWGGGLLLIAVYLAIRGYGELMRRSELKRFEAARAVAPAPVVPREEPPAARAEAPAAMSWPSGAVDTRLWSPKRVREYQESIRSDLGHPLAVLRIPRIDIEVPVLDGTDEPRLNRGVGWIEGTAEIGHGGNVGIAGHRDGYFRGLKDIQLGDELLLETLGGTERYRVDDLRIVLPSDVSVLAPTEAATITLVTCYPFYYVGSAPQRFIVRARAE